MHNLRDISPILSGKESETMDESMELSGKVKSKVESLIDSAIAMIDDEGLDGASWVSDYVSGDEEPKDGDMEAKKKLIVLAMQKKNGTSEDE